MLQLFNTLGRKMETFHPANREVVTMFTCGPSVYQRSHIGNFRTFLFEDILVRYLIYSGHDVKRGMNFTDIEDKALKEAEEKQIPLDRLTEKNIEKFLEEMDLLRIKVPDYLPRASRNVDGAVEIIERLLELKVAYWYKGNVYFDPTKVPLFGQLYGLDMSTWPKKKRRFHKDTYPGMQWNLGDFILWHGSKNGDSSFWDTRIGRGRPSWNVQDPSMISAYFDETLSIYCGGIDNLYRHHDYTLSILESVRPYPMAKYWLHCHHLHVRGEKMSKSRGNIYYTDTLLEQGYDSGEIRFFLIYGHYREDLNFSDRTMLSTAEKLRRLRNRVGRIGERAKNKAGVDCEIGVRLKSVFSEKMDNDLDVKGALDGINQIVSGFETAELSSGEAAGIILSLREIDEVLKVIF